MTWPGAVTCPRPATSWAHLPQRGNLSLPSYDRRRPAAAPPETIRAVLAAGRHVHELIVVDTPRWPDPGAHQALDAADVSLLLMPPQLRAATAAVNIAAEVDGRCDEVQLVVSGPSPGQITAREVTAALRLPLAGTVNYECRVVEALETGRPPATTGRGSLAIECRRLADQLL